EQRSTAVEGKFHDAVAVREYPLILQEAGFPIHPGQEQQAAELMKQSPIKEQLVAALDDWAIVAWKQRDKGLHQRLLYLARMADPEPWKDQVRTPAAWTDPLVGKALADKALADRKLLERLSRQILTLVGLLLSDPDAEEWLRQAQLLHP